MPWINFQWIKSIYGMGFVLLGMSIIEFNTNFWSEHFFIQECECKGMTTTDQPSTTTTTPSVCKDNSKKCKKLKKKGKCDSKKVQKLCKKTCDVCNGKPCKDKLPKKECKEIKELGMCNKFLGKECKKTCSKC